MQRRLKKQLVELLEHPALDRLFLTFEPTNVPDEFEQCNYFLHYGNTNSFYHATYTQDELIEYLTYQLELYDEYESSFQQRNGWA